MVVLVVGDHQLIVAQLQLRQGGDALEQQQAAHIAQHSTQSTHIPCTHNRVLAGIDDAITSAVELHKGAPTPTVPPLRHPDNSTNNTALLLECR